MKKEEGYTPTENERMDAELEDAPYDNQNFTMHRPALETQATLRKSSTNERMHAQLDAPARPVTRTISTPILHTDKWIYRDEKPLHTSVTRVVIKSDDVEESSPIRKYSLHHRNYDLKLYRQGIIVKHLQGTHVFRTKNHGWSHEWLQLTGNHNLVKLFRLVFSITFDLHGKVLRTGMEVPNPSPLLLSSEYVAEQTHPQRISLWFV
ncbi:hypothetical protein Cgig2_016431 [Carnegiea gigantea]|uniref:Uncharacterized protein n=1 Tax=Carnegiea gigantea TaxID=171969 RepID=A0A9Q1K2S5_9CARY|nr:hypothetical protein Cgig2_016431 [Carnegiea gigantea]